MPKIQRPSLQTGSRPMPDRIKGLNRVTAKLADGAEAVYWYHRASGTRLTGAYGSEEFVASLAAAQEKPADRTAGTLAGLIRDFEKTAKWRKLAEATQKEYRRIFTFWDGKFGTVPYRALEAKLFRQKVLEWHDEFSEEKPREADNRVTVLARVLSWAERDGPLNVNVLDGFERAYSSDRSEMIWEPEHIEAFMAVANDEMKLAMMLALHTGQRHADIRHMAWGNYDGSAIRIRQQKARRKGKTPPLLTIPCTAALKETLDGLTKRGALIMPTKTGRAFQKRYLSEQWEKTFIAAELANTKLHFHDLRGTTVTMLFEAGCTVAECASITGHTLRTAQAILDKYLARTSRLAYSAIAKFENRMEQERAKRPAKGHTANGAK